LTHSKAFAAMVVIALVGLIILAALGGGWVDGYRHV
jgi:hypothetical protein